ncbi:MAG: SDR family NAD(P)-dependent oxidoreductase [Polyangiales bacterium]|nr:SDR family NAD(P)-dependent oxidoreductase [Myxococcales bacterium]
MTSFRQRYGPWALVAGASEGLGLAFADECARRGLDVVLVARRAQVLEERARELSRRHGVKTYALALDLAGPGLAERARAIAAELPIGLVILDAAYAPRGELHDRPLDELLRAIDVNVRAPLTLARELGAPMRERGRGGLIVVSSVAGLRGTETLATYAATKAFGRVLAEGLYAELRPRGVDVLACLAGATRTPGYEATTRRDVAPVMEPDDVARATLDALGRGPVFVPGRSNRAAVWALERVLPRRVAIALLGRSTRALNG